MPSTPEGETKAEAKKRKAEYERQQAEYEKEQERKAEARRQEEEQRQRMFEAERKKREKLQKAHTAAFDRIIDHAPATFSAAQLRVFLRALSNIDAYSFADDVAQFFEAKADGDRNDQTVEQILLSTLDGLTDDKLTGFALRFIYTGHAPIPRADEIDFLTEAEAVFAPPQPKATANVGKSKKPIKTKTAAKKTAAKPTPKPAAKKTTAKPRKG